MRLLDILIIFIGEQYAPRRHTAGIKAIEAFTPPIPSHRHATSCCVSTNTLVRTLNREKLLHPNLFLCHMHFTVTSNSLQDSARVCAPEHLVDEYRRKLI